jgi:hypothetical protein
MGYTNIEEKFAFGQHKVRADILPGSLAVFVHQSPRFASRAKGRGVGREFRPRR